MKTQPTTQGLMQLAKGPDQTDKSSEKSKNSEAQADDAFISPGFAGILAGLKPRELARNGSVDSLPQTGQDLPPSEAMGSAEVGEGYLVEDGQGFYAQSLVSNLLASKGAQGIAKNSANDAISDARDPLKQNLSSPANLFNAALETDAEMDLGSPLNAEARRLNDRFLGAQGTLGGQGGLGAPGSSGLSLATPAATETTTAGSAQVASSSLAALQVETALTAANSNEDPVTQSLQDLNHLEEREKSELENKLILGERKQDDQTLKLSKGQQAWGDALTERISMNAAKNMKQVTIHLDPPELGTLELKMQVKDDQQTQIQVHVQSPQVKEALESSAQRLRDMLASQGLELSEFDVQTSPDQGQGNSGDNSGDAEEGLAQNGQQDSDALGIEGENISVGINLPKNNNLLDTFV